MAANNNSNQGGGQKPQPQGNNGKGGITFTRYITLKNGRVLDAHDYGLKSWPVGKNGKK